MGDVVVSTLVKEIVGRLTSEVVKEFGLLLGLKDEILRLKHDFDQIEVVLEDAEEKHIKEKEVELWLRDLKSTSLMVDNALDEVSTQALLQRLHKKRGLKYMVRAYFSSEHNQLMFRVRIAHKVKALRRKLDVVASKRSELGLTPGAISHIDVDVAREMPDRETSSLMHDSSVIYGRNEEMEMVTRTICDKDIGKYDNGEIRVYGIWGMGGVGKTTLAQLVYNNERVNRYFELRCWVYVSENFQIKEIMKKIIESIDKYECKLTQLDTLQYSLQNKLRGKKFLIVLDDVWIEEDEKAKWEELSKTLSYGAEGSIVVMTTRSSITSHMVSKVGELQYELGCLSEEDSWLLFKKLAFAQGRVGGDEVELENIGKEIVEKCKGLPLALKSLGSLMWSKRSTIEWKLVKDSSIWEVEKIRILPAVLKLSYDNLLPHLKRGEISLYVLGEEIFNCLVWRSFFHIVKDNKLWGDRYKMHDLIHDMAQHVMRHDFLVIELACNEVKFPNEVLHLSSSCPEFFFSHQNLKNLTLRSILMFGEINESGISQIFNHIYLRVLYLCGIGLRTLPKSICKLKHLRYLNLSESSIKVLPESIIYLQNLQVLLLCYCHKLCKLPEGLKFMTNLQCLDVSFCTSLLNFPFGINELTSLRILPWFLVGKESGAKIGELGDLNLIEGELQISGLENVGGLCEAKSAGFKCKTFL
ncbi:putative P-loop containing nucleoside triphosphate hydrolase, leucine-rich repeat domain superfamily [Helianthus annuus]|nr:putative P-loop containing nucleoside triphosphate hydrolase, leucine-rich repeat domain superfamily [Helianthus annuus]KAJ0784852.1 putative P-loop containing nucleoside triphosphate hydrolase, leucine-rich repeat domain superfamily [Helianthus annuus]KAJ0794119.1 putative P-loop containing nucleoside triphosphate hydrolase, leucine-rich repeat domain superfamily [Helianthus annuus]KAJ0958746.1 putative P-loop containing nucleoside triphosphate hydrolase, leucine-rich repeat domain superfami